MKSAEEIRTELVFILDRSGSMSGLEDDTIGGYNGVLSKQQNVKGQINVTTILFDDQYEVLHNRIPLRSLKPITRKDYYTRGSTALLDAIGRTIQKIETNMKYTLESSRANKVIFVITTDGYENSSREFSIKQVKKMVSDKQRKDAWEFLFLGANIDAIDVAGSFGIPKYRAANFVADSCGFDFYTEGVGNAVNESMSRYRVSDNRIRHLLEPLHRDHKKRGK